MNLLLLIIVGLSPLFVVVMYGGWTIPSSPPHKCNIQLNVVYYFIQCVYIFACVFSLVAVASFYVLSLVPS